MLVTPELTVLHRTGDELRSSVGSVRSRYGDTPAVHRLIGEAPLDPAPRADAAGAGLGRYHRGPNR